MANRLIGLKVWYGDGSHVAVPLAGRKKETETTLAALPSTGVQVVMLYYDQFSTVTCRYCVTNQPFDEKRAPVCANCGEETGDVAMRYRRVLQANDHYWVGWDSAPAPERQDWVIGQTDREQDVADFALAHLKGGWTSDLNYQLIVEEAMADMAVSEFGLQPVGFTSDT